MISIDCSICEGKLHVRLFSLGNKLFPINIALCKGCGFVFQNPRFAEQEWDEYYRNDYDKYHRPVSLSSPSQNAGNKEIAYAITHRLKQYVPNVGIQNVLEIGAGQGEILQELGETMKITRALAVEPSDSCRKKLAEDGVDVVGRNVNDLRGRKFMADIIIMRHVLEHLFDPAASLSIILDLLSEDGCLYIAVPNLKGFPNDLLKAFIFPHMSYFTKVSLMNCLAKAGFDVVHAEEDGNELFVIAMRGSVSKSLPPRVTDEFRSEDFLTYLSRSYSRRRLFLTRIKRFISEFVPERILRFLLRG